MSTVISDLWPKDIVCDDVLTPEEILKHQASHLEARTNGLLVADVIRFAGADRVVLGFEVVAPRADSRVRLFEVQHRLSAEYPAAIIPPREDLPDFLKDRVYRPAPLEASIARELKATGLQGGWVENQWVATSPTEFAQKVEKVLARPDLKASVLSMLSRARRENSSNGERGNAEQEAG